MPDERNHDQIRKPDTWSANLGDDITRHTRERGQKMGTALRAVFEKIGFNQKLITANGALCLDVGYGPEIEALRSYNPRTLVASEELDNLQENLMGREKTLNQLGQGLPFHLVSGYTGLGIDYVTKKLGTKVGLVTQLNTFPKRLTTKYLNGLITRAPQVLVPGGIMLISATKEDAQSANGQLEKVVSNQKNNGVDTNILRLKSNDLLNAGQTFLVVKCK